MRSTLNPLLRPARLLPAAACGVALTTTITLQAKHRNMSSTTSNNTRAWPTRSYEPRHATWPYQESDFAREDSNPDTGFYATSRFVTHIDDAAISSLRDYYNEVLPRKGKILDLCSSWISHYPKAIENAATQGDLKVTGMGMNGSELAANEVLNHRRIVVDLNEKPDVAAAINGGGGGDDAGGKLDASTMVVSIDYLIKPVEVLRSLREVTKDQGVVHLTVSNRCFPTKAIARWLRVSEEERLQMVGDFLHFAGWKHIEIVELSNGKTDNEGGGGSGSAGALGGIRAFLGANSRDPLWVVKGVKE
ncbi:hypothetical protein SCUP515_05373 [Seiridium cupressi]